MAEYGSGFFSVSKHLWRWLERWTVIVLFTFLLLLALLQIVLRNFFSTGFLWADVLMRNMLLWIALLGASIATMKGSHICINLLPKLLPHSIARGIEIFNLIFQTIILTLLSYASLKYVSNERLAGDIAFLSVPFWWFEIIFPLTFSVMAVRFATCLLTESFGNRPKGAE